MSETSTISKSYLLLSYITSSTLGCPVRILDNAWSENKVIELKSILREVLSYDFKAYNSTPQSVKEYSRFYY